MDIQWNSGLTDWISMCQTSPQDVAMGIHWLQDFGTPGHQGCPIFMASWVDFPAIQAQLLSLCTESHHCNRCFFHFFPKHGLSPGQAAKLPPPEKRLFHDLPITTRVTRGRWHLGIPGGPTASAAVRQHPIHIQCATSAEAAEGGVSWRWWPRSTLRETGAKIGEDWNTNGIPWVGPSTGIGVENW